MKALALHQCSPNSIQARCHIWVEFIGPGVALQIPARPDDLGHACLSKNQPRLTRLPVYILLFIVSYFCYIFASGVNPHSGSSLCLFSFTRLGKAVRLYSEESLLDFTNDGIIVGFVRELTIPRRSDLTNFNTGNGHRPEVQPLTLLYIILAKKVPHFIYLFSPPL